jgi:putative Mg2+ transporter-C (MgtC) family protein
VTCICGNLVSLNELRVAFGLQRQEVVVELTPVENREEDASATGDTWTGGKKQVRATLALFTFGGSETWVSLGRIVLSYVLTLPIGWEREQEAHSVGVRTFPLVAIASCGYLLVAFPGDPAAQSRVLAGLITGIGFIGGGAILKEGGTVRGTATAASIWSTGVVGAAVAMGRYEIAVILSLLNLVTLKVLWRLKQKIDRAEARGEKGSDL